ncbi:hypothetical protein [Streptomyces tailanensis]|uniref:hypothetical protein n=1 Tax=Streptomyces tailanensis TaxID=2569858 RepID=UPI00122EA275|nr:hypothetical protein [Streptomyces tailanensis]
MKRQIIRNSGVGLAALTMLLAGTTTAAHAAPTASSNSAFATNAQASLVKYNPNLRAKNVRKVKEKCGKSPIAEASGRGRMTLRIDETRSAGTTYSKKFEINFKQLSHSVGWDITKSRSITVSGAKEVPRGKYGVLKAYTRYAGKKFDVYHIHTPWKISKRNVIAYKPIGVCFTFKAS